MTYSSAVLSDSPLAYYRLGEASGTTMVDSSGNARDGTYVNSPALGATGLLTNDTDTAAGFGNVGANSPYAYVVDDDAYDGLSTFSVEAFIRPSSVSGTPMIASRDDSGSRSWQFRLNAGKLEFVKIANGTVTASSSATLSIGTIYHVAATYAGSTVRRYINGAQDGTVSTSGDLGTVNCWLRIGSRRTTTTTDYFSGTIDEVAVYGTTLPAGRIAAHYAANTFLSGAWGLSS